MDRWTPALDNELEEGNCELTCQMITKSDLVCCNEGCPFRGTGCGDPYNMPVFDAALSC